MPQLNDAQFDALRSLGFTGALNDMTLQWLQSLGATSAALTDAWREALLILTALPAATYQRNDYWFVYLGTQGFTGALNDRELAYWVDQLVGP